MKTRSLAALGLWVALGLWPLREMLESDMAIQMALQIPMLVCVGLLLAEVFSSREPPSLIEADWLGIPGILLVVFATSFWMLPRMLDAALADPLVELAKFLSWPLLVGLPLGLSWRRMPAFGRAFVWANFISMLGTVGGLYLAAPTRLCAYYRLDQQVAAGWTLLTVAAALTMLWFLAAIAGWPRSQSGEERRQSRTGTALAK